LARSCARPFSEPMVPMEPRAGPAGNSRSVLAQKLAGFLVDEMKPGAGQTEDGNIRIGPVLRGGRRKPMLNVRAQPWTFEQDMSAHGREICRSSRAGSLPYVCVVGGPGGRKDAAFAWVSMPRNATTALLGFGYENTVVLRNPQGASKALWWLSPGLLFIPNQFVPAGGRLRGGPFIFARRRTRVCSREVAGQCGPGSYFFTGRSRSSRRC
jgi:hypothetical protein